MKPKHLHIHQQVTDVGRKVQCDICDRDWTDSPESGGFIFGSKAYCPSCAPGAIERIVGYGEQKYIRATCPQGMSFADFVRAYRAGNNKITITTMQRTDSANE